MVDYSKQMISYYKHKGKKSYKQKINKALCNLKNKAAKTGIPFSITIEDLALNKVCPILGIPLFHEGDRNNTPSIDKIIPSLGYIPGNVRIISLKANRWKNDMTEEDANKLAVNWNKLTP